MMSIPEVAAYHKGEQISLTDQLSTLPLEVDVTFYFSTQKAYLVDSCHSVGGSESLCTSLCAGVQPSFISRDGDV